MITETPVLTVGDIARAVDNLVTETNLRWWFRGVDSTRYDLLPSVRWKNYTWQQEQYLYNEFYCRAGTRYARCPDEDDLAGWLSLMQHYRLPTRLLDWTFSPLIATYFAVLGSGEGKEDACVWALAPGLLNASQGFKALLYPLSAKTVRPLLEPARKGTGQRNKTIAAMAVEIDARMQMQQGAFTVHSSKVPLNKLPNSDKWLQKLVIPKDSVSSLRRELQLLGFRADYLFPDLESLASELGVFIKPTA